MDDPTGLRRGTPRLIATDLDGTLLRSDGTVSGRSVAALRGVAEVGLETVLVTARPPRWLDELAHVVGARGVAICGNGAFRYDVARQRVFRERTMARDVVTEIVRDLREQVPGTGFAAERSTGLAAESMFAAIHDHPEDLVTTSEIELLRDAAVGKLLARNPHLTDEEFIEVATQVVGDRAIVAFSGAGGLAEISALGVTKAAALREWSDELGIASEEVWAFGDMPNDLPMLQWAGRSFAVANAHPDVLTAVTDHCPGNDEDGVARTLEMLLDGLGP
ncbi:HAD family hydrolase [Janibacter cremeus]|uniref:HAD family hydrolase n=1 Tax=Janibacter cremeus TaxID=1285192 RepID=UPI0023F9C5B4|nr:HAD family hydrolase [Janibacter cremeus]WEV78427.1 HAD family hydrolase [Janibacter cremeus]